MTEKCCGNCKHCCVDAPLDPQEMELVYCALTEYMVDYDDTCNKFEEIEE